MKRLLLFLCPLFLPFALKAQVDCDNIGFERGNLDGWTLSYGNLGVKNGRVVYLDEVFASSKNLLELNHSGLGKDPWIASVNSVSPGSNYAMRIGNRGWGNQFSRIQTTYEVTDDNTFLKYQFATILQNPITANNQSNHPMLNKPGIDLAIFDDQGNAFPCGTYRMQPPDSTRVYGFNSLREILYRDWRTGMIDLRKYKGKKIKIVVTTHGCVGGAHFGYIYFDAECIRPEVKQSADCADEQGYLTLVAPAGFGRYTWGHGDTTRATRVKAEIGKKYQVSLLPENSLSATCSIQLDYVVRQHQFSATLDSTVCEGEKVVIGDTAFAASGTYIVRIPVSNVCDSLVTLNLKVLPMTLSVTPDVDIREGDSVRIAVTAHPPGSYTYLWEGDKSLSCMHCAETYVKPVAPTDYTVMVRDEADVCRRLAHVKIGIKPCTLSLPDAFSPNDDQLNEVFFAYGTGCIKRIQEMVVYNRQGEVVFRQQNFAASDPKFGWDGSYRGQPATPGTYPYKLRAETSKGEMLRYEGVVNLMR